ncbi:MAG: hypothetical protein QXG18_02620 [Candidatus Pacearchaeota archaeon]
MKREENLEEKSVVRTKKIPRSFLYVLTIVSVLGFLGIASKTLFEKNIDQYIEILWLFVFGFGLLFEAGVKKLFRIKRTGMTSEKFRGLVTAVLGCLAILTGILLLPRISIKTPALLAVQGIISVIAIIFIIIQTVVSKD